ncbi:MAG: OmpA family protein, partial [Rhodobacteraceae bacterium]
PLVSRSRTAGFIQVISVSAPGGEGLRPTVGAGGAEPVPAIDAPSAREGLAAQLLARGHAELPGLTFATGSATLSEGRYDSLAELAGFLTENPGASVVLVGHTDATGSLESNIAISRQRAQSVRDRLVSAHGIAASRLGAEGMGYLAPRDTNLTEEGRTRNRRVEAVLLTLD